MIGLTDIWQRRGGAARWLLPVSWLYRAVWRLRQAAYSRGLFPVERMPVPVVVVGNVIAGGAGKTPAVIALVEHLQARGIGVGVVSRGYGRTPPPGDDDGGVEVSPQSDPGHVGDEPLLIARRTGAPVFVGRRRGSAARRLLAAHRAVQVLVCDDGLQHRALARDIEVCVFDDRGIGNGWLLPAGPLREPWPRAVDLVLHTGARPAFAGFRGARRLADAAVGRDGSTVPLAVLAMSTAPLVAVAGIARPQTFFAMLRDRGLPLAGTCALPDHADPADFGSHLAAMPDPGADTLLLCTEKDAAKLWPLRPDALAVPLLFALPQDFLARFDRLLDARLSSASR